MNRAMAILNETQTRQARVEFIHFACIYNTIAIFTTSKITTRTTAATGTTTGTTLLQRMQCQREKINSTCACFRSSQLLNNCLCCLTFLFIEIVPLLLVVP